MTEGLKWTVNHVAKSDDKHLELMSEENVKKANEFHKSFPQYTVTPLQDLAELASYLGVKSIHCKDESYRFGLNAFKVLGGSYAMGRYIAKEVGKDISELPYAVLSSEELRKEFGQATFFTATDGNHGRGVAWAAKRLGQKAVVRMPKGTTKTRFDNIAKEGATVTIEEVNYDDCVRMAAAEAAKTEHGIIVQDTAWDGYEEIPSWIMQGYGTMVMEADQQLASLVSGVTGYEMHSTVQDSTDAAGCSDYFVLKLGIPAVTIENGGSQCPMPIEEYQPMYQRNQNLWPALAEMYGK